MLRIPVYLIITGNKAIFDCCYIDKIGHTDTFPVKDNLEYLVDEVIQSIKLQANGQNVLAVGHSLGGVLTVLAALKAPELFQQIILLDIHDSCHSGRLYNLECINVRLSQHIS